MYAQIITDIAHQDVDRVFTYRVPEALQDLMQPGMRVVVPFGKQKAVEGYVLSVSQHTELPEEILKDVIRFCDPYPVMNDDQIALIDWMKKQYHTTAVQVIRLLLPAEMRSGRVNEKYVVKAVLAVDVQKAEKLLSSIRYGTKQYQVMEWLIANGSAEKAFLNQTFGDVSAPLRALCAKGAVRLEKEETHRSPYKEMQAQTRDWHLLKEEQQAALEAITEAVEKKQGNILLHGVTGSGKTEVYMRAIDRVLESGGSAIMLIPEISLTPQTVLRFRERFGQRVAVLHSALSMGERFDEWRRIRSGEAEVVVGARSAVFAPCRNVRLIIIDEAHEGSYRADQHPQYDAVAVANERARLNGGITVLGSATPSVEQFFAAQKGEYRLVKLTQRVNGKPLPSIEVVDMAKELAAGNRSIFSRTLYAEMQKTIADGKQVILFLNRRGHSTVVTCRACGETVKCPNCEVSMTFHSSAINSRTGANRLRCHYCGEEIPYPKVCPSCGSKYIKYMGAGTEKVEDECRKLFPEIGILRMDNDTTGTKDAHFHILSKFAAGEAQVLIGTQMIAKGLDFPGVALVGIVSADTMLQLPDYRSRERTFGLLTQVSGRAGRADTAGKVILQTYTPKHYAISDAVRYSYEDFYRNEVAQRQVMQYPPFARYIRIIFIGADGDEVKRACYNEYTKMRQTLTAVEHWRETMLHFGMMAAPILRIRGQYRYQILIKMKKNVFENVIEQRIFELYDQINSKTVYVNIEIDPENLT